MSSTNFQNTTHLENQESLNISPVKLDVNTINDLLVGINGLSTVQQPLEVELQENPVIQTPPRQQEYKQLNRIDPPIIKRHPEPSMDLKIFNEINMPIIIGVLFFVFQLPETKNKIIYLFPAFLKDELTSILNLNGHIIITLLFVVCYYLLNKYLN